MASLDRNLRRDLENSVKKARRVAESGARAALLTLGVGDAKAPSGVDPGMRKRLRAHGRQLGDRLDDQKGTQAVERLVGECAYEHWHRLLFARFLAENDLLVEPTSGMAVSLDECRELARERGVDWLVLASDFAQRMLPQIFRAGDPLLEVALPPETRQELERLLEALPQEMFRADDALGWVYQFWQAEQKAAVDDFLDSGGKAGADEIPAKTQLFTDDYMVLFLLHNTLGAWWAGRMLRQRTDLLSSAASEEALRSACSLSGIDWAYLRFMKGEDGRWAVAAGTMDHWPDCAKQLTVLDPSMGSGHFLVFALPILVAFRVSEEGLTTEQAVDAVLRDNLFGLEVDPRCTQIAAFNLALAAWRITGYRPLPKPNLACSGLALSTRLDSWLKLGGDDLRLRGGMERLFRLFEQAPTLGSLIDPRADAATLLAADFRRLEPLLAQAMSFEPGNEERAELAVTAAGVARAAEMLTREFVLVATNVPYLARGKQDPILARHCEAHFGEAKTDLATCFVERCRGLSGRGGSVAVVTPQNWLAQDHYSAFRKKALRETRFMFAAQLGPGAFSGITGEVVKPLLFVFDSRERQAAHAFLSCDTTGAPSAREKAVELQTNELLWIDQGRQLANPKHRIVLGTASDEDRLSKHAVYSNGIQTGDAPRFLRSFWELPRLDERWVAQQTTVDATTPYGGMSQAVLWEGGEGTLARFVREKLGSDSTGAWLRGKDVWDRRGVLVSAMGSLSVSLYLGTLFDDNSVAVVPKADWHLPALWAFMSDAGYHDEVRRIDKALKVRGPLIEVPFDLGAWSTGHTFPAPTSHDPTQWIFDGHPRSANSPLQVAVARLLGYQWPRQTGSSFFGFPGLSADGLERHADEDGVVCLMPLKGELAAGDRLRALLADAFGAEWSPSRLAQLLNDVGFAGKNLEDWLRDGFFDQHCELFNKRPFVLHVWDGLKDGFSAFVSYHKLTGADGEGRRTLEKLIYTYLGDWIDRQRSEQAKGAEGADGRVAAAQHLKQQLEAILEGEPPFDIFVRWKRVQDQALGWDPDVDDGVRINIRPLLTAKPLNGRARSACILRVSPDVKWGKDKGKEATRIKADFPWFWGWDDSATDFLGGAEFDGSRWNDLHYSRAVKLAARERAKGGKS